MKYYLVFGVSDNGTNNSMIYGAVIPRPQDCADALRHRFMSNYDEIFLIENGKDCPDVTKHWVRYKDYDKN
jgi:hypothetical protein